MSSDPRGAVCRTQRTSGMKGPLDANSPTGQIHDSLQIIGLAQSVADQRQRCFLSQVRCLSNRRGRQCQFGTCRNLHMSRRSNVTLDCFRRIGSPRLPLKLNAPSKASDHRHARMLPQLFGPGHTLLPSHPLAHQYARAVGRAPGLGPHLPLLK
jgi:hypothetical protein